MSTSRDRSISRKTAWLLIGIVLVLGSVASSLGGGPAATRGLTDPFSSILEPERFSERLVEGSGNETIVLLRAEGLLYDSAEENLFASGGVIPIERLSRQIDQATEDESVRAIILLINSPGGTVTASQTIHEKLLAAKAADKSVVTLMREVAASGGYYIATAADKIVANSSTLTGSIGVIQQLANLEALYAKIGYQPITLKAGKLKDIGSPDRPLTDEERDIFQELLDQEYDRFLQVVAEGRGLPIEKVRELAEGRIYSGKQAKELGLVDELGNLPKAIEVAKAEAGLDEARVVEYTGALDGFGLLSELFGTSAVGNLIGSVERLAPTRASGSLYLWQP